MATYMQFKARHPERKLLYYICGPEYAMVQEVKDSVISQWGNSIVVTKLDCKVLSFADVENAVLSSMGGELFVVENAQVLNENQWTKVCAWVNDIVKGRLPVMLVVVTDEEKPDTNQARYRPFVQCGRFVECKEVTGEALAKYCMDDYGLDERCSHLIIDLCGYSFRKLNNELEKLALVRGRNISERDINDFVVFSPGDTVLRSLLSRDIHQAKMVSFSIQAKDLGNLFRSLLIKLLFIYQAYKADRPGIGAHKLAASLGVQPWQLLEYFSIKRHWSIGSLEQHLKLLTEFEGIWSKNQSNVLPLLVQYW